MFPIFRRHAAPKTVFMFTSGTSHGEAIGTLYGAPLYHASLAPEEYRRLLEAAGFHVVAESDRRLWGSCFGKLPFARQPGRRLSTQVSRQQCVPKGSKADDTPIMCSLIGLDWLAVPHDGFHRSRPYCRGALVARMDRLSSGCKPRIDRQHLLLYSGWNGEPSRGA